MWDRQSLGSSLLHKGKSVCFSTAAPSSRFKTLEILSCGAVEGGREPRKTFSDIVAGLKPRPGQILTISVVRAVGGRVF